MLNSWLKNAWLVILTIWEPVHRIIVAFRWPIAAAIIALGTVALGFFWWEGMFTHHKSIEEVRQETVIKVSVNDREYLAAAMH